MKSYRVKGMTCKHCVQAIKEAVEALPNATNATIDLKTETLTIDGDVNESALRKAIDEAGYELV